MFKWINNRLKKLFGIDKLETEIKILKKRIESHSKSTNAKILYNTKYIEHKLNELKEYTRVDADVGIRGNNTIILTGIYKKQAYIRFYDVGNGEFKYLVERLKDMQKHSLIRHIDAVPDFRGVFDL